MPAVPQLAAILPAGHVRPVLIVVGGSAVLSALNVNANLALT